MTKVLNTLSAIGALAMAATPLLAIGGFAHAQDMQLTPAHIAVSDLNFGSSEGVATFRQRVNAVANVMCAEAGARSLDAAAGCHQAVYDEAVSKLGQSQRQDLKVATADRTTGFTLATR